MQTLFRLFAALAAIALLLVPPVATAQEAKKAPDTRRSTMMPSNFLRAIYSWAEAGLGAQPSFPLDSVTALVIARRAG